MIYFDAAATTFQKPPSVRRAVLRAMETMSSPGRGNYQSAALAAETVYACREEIGALFGVEDPENVVFTSNATHSLNLAIHSLVPPGGRVVISGYEHNAVTRPIHAIADLQIHVVNTPLFDQPAMVRGFRDLVQEGTDAVICTHVSNVFGYILPIAEIAGICRERGVPLIVDASQSAGSLPIHMGELGAAFIAMPGHKGLYGPQGTGVLLCAGAGKPLLCGGTGSSSKEQSMPDFLPDRMEAGTHNVPGIAGLLEGVRFVRRTGVEAIGRHGRQLKEQLRRALAGDGRFRVFGTEDGRLQSGVLSLVPGEMDCETFCQAMAEAGFALRGGFHCAPFAHQTAGTIQSGTVRFSVSAFNTAGEVDALLERLRKQKIYK